MPAPVALFNVSLLDSLRPRWESRIRADTPMFDVLFTRPGSTGSRYDERVEVIWESGGGALHCDGVVAPVTKIYPTTMAAADWDGWDDGPGRVPDPRAMTALVFECRSPAWVAEVGRVSPRV